MRMARTGLNYRQTWKHVARVCTFWRNFGVLYFLRKLLSVFIQLAFEEHGGRRRSPVLYENYVYFKLYLS